MTTIIIPIKDEMVKISSKLKEIGVHFPFEKDDLLHNSFKITIETKNGKSSFTFYDSHQNYLDNKTELSDEDLLIAFYSFVEDGVVGNLSFENFCSELGFDPSQNTSVLIYGRCRSARKALSKLFGQNADLDEILSYMREKFNL